MTGPDYASCSSRPRPTTSFSTLAAAAVLYAVCAWSAPPKALAQDGQATDRTVLMVFVAYRGNVTVPIHPTQVRVSASRQLAGMFDGDVITYPDIEPFMRSWRLRSERDLSRGFLRALSTEFDADEVVILKLVTYDDRIVLLGRGLSPGDGALRWVGAEEALSGSDLWKDEAAAPSRLDGLLDAAGPALVESARSTPRHSGGTPLIALPLRPHGLDRGDADLAWQCLLGSLLSAGAWTLPDPALVVDEMQHAGFDPTQLATAARRHLIERFAASELLVPRMTAFPRPGARIGLSAREAVDDDSGSAELDRRVPVLLTLTLIDGGSGRLLSGCAEYLPPERATGLFGRATNTRITHRYRAGADVLVRSLVEDGGSS